MAIEQDNLPGDGAASGSKHKRTTFGTGLLKGLGITFRHLVSPAITMQYPDEKDDYPARSRGVIALKTENCTVCMLCARECPDWCIYIEGHKQAREPVAEGKRAKKFNVLDRFAIDYALCMYCGICVEVCPYDALFWSPEYEYADTDIVELTHEKEKLNEWMYTVLPPMPLDEGAQGPELKAAPAPPAGAAAPPAEAARIQGGPVPAVADTASDQAPVVTPAIAPAESGAQTAPAAEPAPPEPQLDPELVYKAILKGELASGTEEKVAEARARTAAARIKDEAYYIGRKKGAAAAQAAPAATEEPVQSAETPAASTEIAPAAPPEPAAAEAAAPAASAAGVSDEEASKVRQQVLQEQLAKGSDPRVAEARAKAAEMRARKGTKGPA